MFTDIFLLKDPALEESSLDIIINCCYAVVLNPQLASSLLAKFETYVSVLQLLVLVDFCV